MTLLRASRTDYTQGSDKRDASHRYDGYRIAPEGAGWPLWAGWASAETPMELKNDLVYIFAGGELPTSFLQKAGVEITKRFGHIVKKH